MIAIPSINCTDRECARGKIAAARSVGTPWVHVDVADGVFAPVVLFGDARSFFDIVREGGFSGHVEVHLMVEYPELRVREWLAAGAKRIIVHVEAIGDVDTLKKLQFLCGERDVELGCAVKKETSNEALKPFLGNADFWTVLAVPAGFSGGVFDEARALEKLAFLKESAPGCVVEIDGGMNEKTGMLAKERGADIIVSGSFIFGSADPKGSYQKLLGI